MAIIERVELYQKIEAKRKAPLIVYVTSQRPYPGGQLGKMAGDAIEQFIDQIEAIEKENKSKTVDVLIESTGGDALTSWRLISLLRTNFKTVNVLVPHSAFSAATLFALGADEIVMGRFGSLGPIDPQITVRKPDGNMQHFAYEDVAAFIDFVREEGHLTEQEHMRSALEKLCDVVEPTVLGRAKRSSLLAVSMGEKMLQMHMTDSESKTKAGTIAKKLNKSFFSHGHALSKDEATNIGLNIIVPDAELEGFMWAVHKDFETELKTRDPFDPVAEFLRDPLAKPYLSSPPPLHIPPGINQQVAGQMLQQYFNQQLNVSLPELEVELKQVCVESTRSATEYYSRVRILLQRDLNMQFKGNMVNLQHGWREVKISTPATKG